MEINDNTSINTGVHKKVFPLKQGLIKIALGLILLIPVSCKKFIDIPAPITKLTSSTVFTNDATATAAIVGIYYKMTSASSFSSRITLLAGLSADEFKNYAINPDQRESFYANALLANNGSVKDVWGMLYQYIYSTNAALEGLANSPGISPAIKKQLEGEAKFLRGFCYFYLVNLYGDVPLILTTDYRVNEIAFRAPTAQVYQQIITDMTNAQSLLADDYAYSNGERTRLNKWAATAMLARAYLYSGDWANAELQATAVINKVDLYQLVSDLNSVFLKGSPEAIWQLQPVRVGVNTDDGNQFILNSAPNNINTVALTDQAVADFETGDNRKRDWVGTFIAGTTTFYFPYKYKIKTSPAASALKEYLIVLRLAEQYLIRAEARAQLNNISGSQSDINTIRRRAGGGLYPLPGTLPNTTASDKASLLLAIEKERRVELLTEWGHRWLDLKRTGRANSVLAPVKPGWQSTDALYPIPQEEMLRDKNLTPNPGY